MAMKATRTSLALTKTLTTLAITTLTLTLTVTLILTLILTLTQAFENAVRLVMVTGGSTNYPQPEPEP